MITDSQLLKTLMQQGKFLPKEEMLEIERKKGRLKIGIPKELSFQERRVALVPETVSLLVAHGHHVLIESKAGENSNFSDNEYSEAGAEISSDRNAIYQCNIILKVAPPSEEEVDLMTGNQLFISALQIAAQPKEILQKLIGKKITAIDGIILRTRKVYFPSFEQLEKLQGLHQF